MKARSDPSNSIPVRPAMPTKLPTDNDLHGFNELYTNHAADVGHVAIAWNGLHEALGELFAEVLMQDGRSAALAVWQAVQSDRSKRAMLKAAYEARSDLNSTFTNEVRWALDQLNSLEDKRNDALHSPYAVVIQDGELKIIPYIFGGSQRARKLANKADLAAELQSYSSNMDRLRQFAMGLRGKSRRSARDEPSWPERPSLPRLAQATVQKSRSPRTPPE